uniref:Uncharacterized protein n=1 Tax=Leersia perrieri TaxID=77586 RepID=A0A0D9VMM8_9ORYZ
MRVASCSSSSICLRTRWISFDTSPNRCNSSIHPFGARQNQMTITRSNTIIYSYQVERNSSILRWRRCHWVSSSTSSEAPGLKRRRVWAPWRRQGRVRRGGAGGVARTGAATRDPRDGRSRRTAAGAAPPPTTTTMQPPRPPWRRKEEAKEGKLLLLLRRRPRGEGEKLPQRTATIFSSGAVQWSSSSTLYWYGIQVLCVVGKKEEFFYLACDSRVRLVVEDASTREAGSRSWTGRVECDMAG